MLFYSLLVIVVQLICGNIDEVFFKAPLNIAILLLWLLALLYFRKTPFIKKLSGKKAAIAAIVFIILCAGVVGFTPQLSPAAAQAEQGIAGALGFYNFTQSWIMIGAILLLITNLWLIILKRASLKNTGFFLNHFGLLLVLVSALFGSADIEKLRMQLKEGNTEHKGEQTGYSINGNPVHLAFELHLDHFITQYYPNGTPMRYTAKIIATDANVPDTNAENFGQTAMSVEVNHPAHYRGYDIYLISYGDHYCIIELQKHPWKYPLATGIILMLAGAITLFMRKRENEPSKPNSL